MAHVRKDTLARTRQWARHLRPPSKRRQAKAERRAESLEIQMARDELMRPDPDPEAAAFERADRRSVGAEDRLLAEEGGGLTEAQFARGLGVRSRTTLQRYRHKTKVIAVRHRGRLWFPAWQIHRGALLPGLAETLAILASGGISDFSLILFYLTPAEALEDQRPLDLLRRGETDKVIAHAGRSIDSA